MKIEFQHWSWVSLLVSFMVACAVEERAISARDGGQQDVVGRADLGENDTGPVDTGTIDVVPKCQSGESNCGGICVDRSANRDHCGACGRRCALPERCVGGTCVSACLPQMAFISYGAFDMGTTFFSESSPVRRVTMSSFCMDVDEVTVFAYRLCPSGTCATPYTGEGCNWHITGRDNHPVNCLAWSQARTYCQWLGGDLPTEAQWEYAARGSENLDYPWGNSAPFDELCWSGVTPRSGTCVVNSFSAGVSPFGLHDMVGNVSEWVLDWYGPFGSLPENDPTGSPTGSVRVNRGGSWSYDSAATMRAAFRNRNAPTYSHNDLGFRCARNPR